MNSMDIHFLLANQNVKKCAVHFLVLIILTISNNHFMTAELKLDRLN